ncbi:MAG TPA: SAF domain-containing protein, partial [Marmoricola sp.]
VPTWVAARDLPSGTALTRDDLARARFAPGTVPASAIRDPSAILGRTLAAPLAQGVAVTTGSVVGDGWLRGRTDLAAVPLRVTDPQVVGLLSVGDTVELVAADPKTPDSADVLADEAVVLAIPAAARDVDSSLTGRLVVFGVRQTDAPHITAVATARYVSVVWNP